MALPTLVTTASLHRWSKQSLEHQEVLGLTQYTTQSTAFLKASRTQENPKIPSPTLFSFDAASEAPSKSHAALPTVTECAVHLELLQAFQHLRIRIISSDELDQALGIEPKPRVVFRKFYNGVYRKFEHQEVRLRDLTFEERRKTKWPLMLSLAAARFLKWVEGVEKSSDEPIVLPPTDILMVWHSLLLNPKWFRSLKYKKLSQTPFPWKEIHDAIDSEKRDWPMQLPSCSRFRLATELHPDLLTALTSIRSESIKDLLKQHMTPHQTGRQKGIKKTDVDKILQTNTFLHPSERLLLEHIQRALLNDDMIRNLVDAVTRQFSFVEKMDQQLWIRSPTVEETLQRAIQRYENFLKLFKMYPFEMLVPTLDIDLVWHTHQCSPARYRKATQELAGRFIDHNDKLGSDTLDGGLASTIDLYRVRFAEEYDYCLCWDCEAVKSAVTSKNQGEDQDATATAKRLQSALAYFRAVEIARRKGETLLPIQDENEPFI